MALHRRYVRVSVNAIDCKQGLMRCHPCKGLSEVGGVVGDGAVVDYNFGAMDVCIPIERCGRMERCVERYMDG